MTMQTLNREVIDGSSGTEEIFSIFALRVLLQRLQTGKPGIGAVLTNGGVPMDAPGEIGCAISRGKWDDADSPSPRLWRDKSARRGLFLPTRELFREAVSWGLEAEVRDLLAFRAAAMPSRTEADSKLRARL